MVVIDPSKGGSDVGVVGNNIIEKEFNLLISKYIYDRLSELGIDSKIIRTNDETLNNNQRINKIINSYGDNSNVIAISNRLNNTSDGVEIIYALRNNDKLSKLINDNLNDSNINVSKYYQKRSKEDTSKDFDDIQSKTGNIQTIIIDYGNVNDINQATKLKNDYRIYAEAVVKALASYLNVIYDKEKLDNEYIVQKGDSLYSIANKYNTTVNELKSINNLTSNLLSIGQKLKIPTKEANEYIVQKGDSLYAIANKYNTTVNELKSINNLTSNLLSIGQKLKIPTKEEINYIVQKGDSLYAIAKKYNTTVNELKSINNLTSNLLSIGQQLKIKK